MSEVMQMILNAQSASVTAGQSQQGDAGSEGFAQLFEQQMQLRATAASSSRSSAPAQDAGQPFEVAPPAESEKEDRQRPETDAGPSVADPVRLAVQAPSAPQASAQAAALPAGVPVITAPPAPALPSGLQARTASADAEGSQAQAELLAQPPPPAVPAASPVQPAQSFQLPAQTVAQAALSGAAEVAEQEAPTSSSKSQATPANAGIPAILEQSSAAVQSQASAPSADPAALALSQSLSSSGTTASLAPAAALSSIAASASATATAAAEGSALGASTPVASASGTASSSSTSAAPRASQAEMIERLAAVAKILSNAAGEKVLVMKLQPPQLGHIRIQMMVQNGVLHATVQTESEAARQAVLQNLDHLKTALDELGLRLGRFDVQAEGNDAGRLATGQGGGRRRRSPEEQALEELLAAPAVEAPRRREDGAEDAPVMSDALAVDLLA